MSQQTFLPTTTRFRDLAKHSCPMLADTRGKGVWYSGLSLAPWIVARSGTKWVEMKKVTHLVDQVWFGWAEGNGLESRFLSLVFDACSGDKWVE